MFRSRPSGIALYRGALVFDEYAINEWTESNGVDQFMFEKKVTIKTTNSSMPSAYIVKNNF
jgi:hypothetical protein